MLAKDRGDRKIAPLVAELGERARLGTIRYAADFSDVAFVSFYWTRVEAVVGAIGDGLEGKVVIETMNPLGVTSEFVHFHDHDFRHNNSTAKYLEERLPKARVVKTFNRLAAPLLEAAAWMESPVRPSVFYVTDAFEGGQVARQLIEDAGLVPVNAGPLKGAR